MEIFVILDEFNCFFIQSWNIILLSILFLVKTVDLGVGLSQWKINISYLSQTEAAADASGQG